MSFNLTTEPWIPVITADGATATLSLRDCFSRASEIRKIAAELPTQSFAVLRLLLAICHDAIGFHSDSDIEKLYDEGLDTEKVLAYLHTWHDRFDLFHPERPFYQVATLRTAKDEVSGLEKIISDVPNGDPFLTTRIGKGLERITAAEAALWLVHCQAFDPSGIRSGAVGDPEVKGGKGYPIGPSWAGQIGGIILHGQNLAQTLAFNIVPFNNHPSDRPVWTRDEAQNEKRQIEPQPSGPVDLLAWQSRRVRLVGGVEGVTGVVLAQGDKMTPQNRQGLEAMTAWRYSKPQSKKLGIPVYMPLKHDPARAGWRGLPSLFSAQPGDVEGHASSICPATIMHLEGWAAEFPELQSVAIEIVGMGYGPKEATVAELVNDTTALQISVLGKDAIGVRVAIEDCVRLAEDCVKELSKMAANIARAGGDRDGSDGAWARAASQVWAVIDVQAKQWLSTINGKSEVKTIQQQWQQILKDTLLAQALALADASSPAAVSGRNTDYGFMSTAKAEMIFRQALSKALPLAYEQSQQENNDD